MKRGQNIKRINTKVEEIKREETMTSQITQSSWNDNLHRLKEKWCVTVAVRQDTCGTNVLRKTNERKATGICKMQ